MAKNLTVGVLLKKFSSMTQISQRLKVYRLFTLLKIMDNFEAVIEVFLLQMQLNSKKRRIYIH